MSDEWVACDDPNRMVQLLKGKVSDRKLRLFTSAWLRLNYPALSQPRIGAIVDRADAFVDGLATRDEVREMVYGLIRAVDDTDDEVRWVWLIDYCTMDSAHLAVQCLLTGYFDDDVAPRQSCCDHIRCVFGNPFPRPFPRPVRQNYDRLKAVGLGLLKLVAGHPNFRDATGSSKPAPLQVAPLDPEWRTSTVVAMAEQMYESRDFSAMPILADALQDAGCEDADLLGHCRGPGPHVRGCWVVDLVLEKE